jgi:hypothetical protein
MRSTTLHRSHVARHLLLASVTLVAASGCSDNPLVAPMVPSSKAIASEADRREAIALDGLTRAVAMTLGNAGVRNQLRNDLRDSRHTTEHKLELRSYLKGESGGLLLAQMSRATGISHDSLAGLVYAVRPLELYMPVAAHRGKWTGGADVIVASQLYERDTPIGYDLSGAPVTLSLKTAPTLPTLSLVPVETDFSRPLDATGYKNANDNGGTTIGTLTSTTPGTRGKTPSTRSASLSPNGIEEGLYLSELHVVDAHEPWIKGDPELELHVYGPLNVGNKTEGDDLSCVGQDSHTPYFFDQNANDASYTIGGDAPLVFSRYSINQFQAKFPTEGLTYILWEDDAGSPCVTVTDRNINTALKEAAGAALGAGLAAKFDSTTSLVRKIVTIAIPFTLAVLKDPGAVYGNDDYVGTLMPLQGSGYEGTYAGQTHVIKDGVTAVGSVKIEGEWPTPANGGSYAAGLTPSTTSAAFDQAASLTLGATVTDQNGYAMSGHPISWRSSNSYIATIGEDGVLHSVVPGNATVYVRACDPTCMDRAVNVAVTGPTVSGPSSAYESYASMSASVLNPRQGSYYYVWDYMPCTNTCDYTWHPIGEGLNLTSRSVYITRYNTNVDVRVTIKTSQYGSVVGTGYATVYGGGELPPSECADPSQIICTDD